MMGKECIYRLSNTYYEIYNSNSSVKESLSTPEAFFVLFENGSILEINLNSSNDNQFLEASLLELRNIIDIENESSPGCSPSYGCGGNSSYYAIDKNGERHLIGTYVF